jgi:CTP synthase
MPQAQPVYIFVSGGVLSGVGKGIVTASVALLLKSRGLKVTVVKCENYLNIDSGLINPIEHGDPFLCEDGAETDMDIGTYEKFLDQNFGQKNFITMGQIYQAVITKERNFGYHGEDVEAIPHVTDEIISRIKQAGASDHANVVIVELGGTAGEYQNILYYEASRLMQFAHQDKVIHIHVSYLPTPPHLGEPKTKPTQLSVKALNSMGIHPDFIVARSDRRMDERRRSRFALFCSVKSDHIIDAPDVASVYELPLLFSEQQFDQKIASLAGLTTKPAKLKDWQSLVNKIKTPKTGRLNIAIVGKYFQTGDYNLRDSYAALYDALNHAASEHQVELDIVGLNSETTSLEQLKQQLHEVAGIIVPIGWGGRGVEGKIKAIQVAREDGIPYLGLCYGMQLAVVEYARNVLHWEQAHTAEVDPHSPHPVIHMIPDQERILENRAYGGTMRLGAWQAQVKPGTLTYNAYAKHDGFEGKPGIASERHRHRYEFNDAFASQLEAAGLIIAGRSIKENLVEYIELPQEIHPFFLATQGHPEYKSRPLKPHPFFLEFIRAAYTHQSG